MSYEWVMFYTWQISFILGAIGMVIYRFKLKRWDKATRDKWDGNGPGVDEWSGRG